MNPRNADGSHRVVVTGLGCVSGLGVGCRLFWEGLVSGHSAIRPVRVEQDGLEAEFPAAPVRDYDPLQHFSADELQLRDPFSQFAIVAAREAAADAGLTANSGEPSELGVILGSGGGGEHAREKAAVRFFSQRKTRAHPMLVSQTNLQAAVGLVSIELRATGPSFVVGTGCAAATHAIAQAFLLIRHGMLRRAVTGGSEAPVMYSIFQAFQASRVLSRDTCRPFSRNRDGMALADGAGVLILESMESALERSARVYAEVCGVGMSADASSVVHPDEQGPALALRMALRQAGWAPEHVDYINAHGTGTPVNDVVETRSIKTVFGDHAHRMAVSSTKSVHGHAFGGAGGLELVATILAMQHDTAPPTVNYLGPDPECDLNYVPNEAQSRRIDSAISQSFAFGGLNAVIAVSRREFRYSFLLNLPVSRAEW